MKRAGRSSPTPSSTRSLPRLRLVVVRSDVVQPAPRTAFFAAFLLAVVAGALGVLRASGLFSTLIGRVPIATRDVVASATAGLATVIVISAVLTALALAVAFPDAVEMLPGPRRRVVRRHRGTGLDCRLSSPTWSSGLRRSPRESGSRSVLPDRCPRKGSTTEPFRSSHLWPRCRRKVDAGALAFVALIAPLLGGYAIGAVMHRRQLCAQARTPGRTRRPIRCMRRSGTGRACLAERRRSWR